MALYHKNTYAVSLSGDLQHTQLQPSLLTLQRFFYTFFLLAIMILKLSGPSLCAQFLFPRQIKNGKTLHFPVVLWVLSVSPVTAASVVFTCERLQPKTQHVRSPIMPPYCQNLKLIILLPMT